MPEDDSTSDCINGTMECLCLDLVAETAHSDSLCSFTFVFLLFALLNNLDLDSRNEKSLKNKISTKIKISREKMNLESGIAFIELMKWNMKMNSRELTVVRECCKVI